ncbi:hypothetical protein QN219_27225 [Sinorhizobium sp. 7-81]|nr:hypothetical protein [Sinorhizobium sp. 8-89]MDK1493688.1 hypothetical protein [Sinorhizobium sp. 8-89]
MTSTIFIGAKFENWTVNGLTSPSSLVGSELVVAPILHIEATHKRQELVE